MTASAPGVALLVLVVGLALHNLAMALLWDAGVRGTALDVVAAWKDVLLARRARRGALAARGSIPPPPLGRPARARLRGRRRRLLAPPAGLARRRGDRAGRAVRAASPPAAASAAYFARPPARPLGRLGGAGSSCARRAGGRAGRVGAHRRLRGAAAVVARLGRPRLVSGAARARVRVPLGPARELDLQHRRRGQPVSPRSSRRSSARSRRVRARRRAALRRRAPADAVDASRRRSWSTSASSGRTRAPRSSRCRSGSLVLAWRSGAGGPPSLAVGSLVVSAAFVAAFPTIGPVDVATRRGARVPAGQRARSRAATATRSAGARRRRRATCATCATASSVAAPPLGVRARQRRRSGEAHRRRDQGRASRRTPSSGSTRACRLAAFIGWLVALAVGALAALGRGSRPSSSRSRPRPADRRDRRPLARGRPVRARGRGAPAAPAGGRAAEALPSPRPRRRRRLARRSASASSTRRPSRPT